MTGRASNLWLHDQAVDFCSLVEPLARDHGAHIALTGGCLYKRGPRKDLDLVVYRIRQVVAVDVDGLFDVLARFGVERLTQGEHWCVKAKWRGRDIDFLFPECPAQSDQKYPKEDDDA